MAVLIANNAKSTLAAAIGALDTTLTVASGTETLFPSPSGGDYFYVTLENTAGTVREIVKVTNRSGTTFTIVRAQDDTLANIFAVGSVVELRINKASLTDSVGAAAVSATAAAASATAAAGSATTAAGSASSAATSASTATTQASNASTSATNAANSASAANTSAIAAAAAAASGLYSAVQDKSANYTVVAGDAGDLIRVTTTSGAVTITLPTISTVGDGFKIAIVKWTSDGNVVTVNRTGSDTINGATSVQIGSQYSQVILVADLETSTWFASQSGLGATNVNVDVFSGNGSTTAFTLSSDPSTKNNTYVSISGVYQAKATYSVSGTTLTFSTAPPSGTSNIEVVYGTPLAIGTPSDGTVTAAKMTAGAAASNIGTGGVSTSMLADASVTPVKLSSDAQFMGFKNRIINGAMMIDQRNAGASVTTAGGNNYDPDRWMVYDSGGSKMSVQQVSDAPTGFVKSQKITSLAATSPSSTDYYFDVQRIEGLNVSDLAWGTASAATVTLSFWVKSSLTGSFSGAFGNASFSRSYPFSYTISSANTWEQKTVTVAGDTTGTWATDTSTGLQVLFDLGSGSSRAGTANTWSSSDYRKVTGSVSLINTLNATIQFTGVQLEKGSTATSFDYRPYGTELALCQRYYYRNQGGEPYGRYGLAVAGASTNAKLCMVLPVTMRATSTTIDYGGTIGLYNGGSVITITAFTADVVTKFIATLNCSVASGLTSGGAYECTNNNSASAYIGISAEL